MRAVLYARSACTTPGTEATLEGQGEGLRNPAARWGMEIVEEFRDPGYSGRRLDRPGLNRMGELAQGSGFDVVLRWGPDRGARDSVRLDRILEEWAQLGIRTLLLEGRDRDEGLSPGLRPVVAASQELGVGLAKETVVESSLRLGGAIPTATVRIAEGEAMDPARGLAVSRTGGQ